MKKLIFAFAVGIFIVLPVCAQNTDKKFAGEGDLYPVNIPIVKIYPYHEGYVVTYHSGPKSNNVYIPNSWFVRKGLADGEFPKAARFLLGPGTEWPHMVVYYRDGKFERLRLYVRKENFHESWGNINGSVNLDAQFEGIEDLPIEFR
jgi:hypothetical protein